MTRSDSGLKTVELRVKLPVNHPSRLAGPGLWTRNHSSHESESDGGRGRGSRAVPAAVRATIIESLASRKHRAARSSGTLVPYYAMIAIIQVSVQVLIIKLNLELKPFRLDLNRISSKKMDLKKMACLPFAAMDCPGGTGMAAYVRTDCH